MSNSSIIKTIEDEETGLAKSLGFNKLFDVDSKIDLGVIQEYNDRIAKATDKTKLLELVTQDANAATKNFLVSSEGMTAAERVKAAALHNTTAAAKMSSVALQTLSAVGNALLFAAAMKALEFLVRKLIELVNRVNDARIFSAV